MLAFARETTSVLNTAIDVTTRKEACTRIVTLAQERKSAYICFATAHMLVEATHISAIDEAYRFAEMVNPDGVPVAWCLKAKGFSNAECISGPRLFVDLLQRAANEGVHVGFYGGREETLGLILSRIRRELPQLTVCYLHSPPFRQLTEEEQREDIREIVESETQLLFVGLGSPKQEMWMRQWAGTMPCVSLGVGAAFEFFSGEKRLPPLWVQRLGLNWLVRLCQEPRRLIRRNLASPVFAYLALKQLLREPLRRQAGDA
ncbi:MAG: WecB/TagA/CpsF family glycosyltransferase [Edaphobacter sp.]|uniref:WecB/TagA/CpsF family glycosyltransferase n=1 Tax=Edaphobacter sp. TaxID=1934404 RepID=UPI002391A53E|nr:WecB/TagA/CpsF family glycosyltransferase [Edaphobacter sp.]MDE1175006.1 WecB/TagA/CpsF family glycosyltransferase [Edaphobacter sp.]